jgi:hypothetical protein
MFLLKGPGPCIFVCCLSNSVAITPHFSSLESNGVECSGLCLRSMDWISSSMSHGFVSVVNGPLQCSFGFCKVSLQSIGFVGGIWNKNSGQFYHNYK